MKKIILLLILLIFIGILIIGCYNEKSTAIEKTTQYKDAEQTQLEDKADVVRETSQQEIPYEKLKEDSLLCNVDSDCIRVHADCCGCEGNGKATTINKLHLEEYNKNLPRCACVGVYSDHITCFANPICYNNTCIFDFEDDSVCAENEIISSDQCYTIFATFNRDVSICEHITESDVGKTRDSAISDCKDEAKKLMKTYCDVDEDCMEACLGCCPCKVGFEAYNKKYIQNLGIDPEGNCSGLATVQGCPVNGRKYPVCVNNKCELVQKKSYIVFGVLRRTLESTTVNMEKKSYLIEYQHVNELSKTASIKINEELFEGIKQGDIFELEDGVFLGVYEVVIDEALQNNGVVLFLGTNKDDFNLNNKSWVNESIRWFNKV